jgi:hypothetical protein
MALPANGLLTNVCAQDDTARQHGTTQIRELAANKGQRDTCEYGPTRATKNQLF